MMILLVAALLGAAYLFHLYSKRQQRQRELSQIVSQRAFERVESIAIAENSSAKLNSVRRDEIAAWDFHELREKLQRGHVSCLEVLRTYQYKAIQAHTKTNCATLFIKESERWAADLDEKALAPDFVKPPFFGIPISLKECISLEGYDTTRGFVQDVGKPSKSDSLLVQQVKQLGFIPYVQTNVPQSLLAYSCSNPIYGTTNTPADKSRTSGGSSGGESALLAADGSLIGIGGDVGGSIRIPCHFTGMAGIKPSSLRFSHRGNPGAVPGRPLINANEGPMTKDILTSVEFLKEVWSKNWIAENDPYVPPVVWNDEMYRKGNKYRIGYYVDDGWFTPVPAIQRAVLEAKAHLEAAGHTVVPFSPPKVPQMIRHNVRALCVDGGTYIYNKLWNDIIDPSLYGQMLILLVPIWIQRILAYPVEKVFPRLANVMRAMTLSTAELRETYAEIEQYRGDFVELMMENKIDALLCPPQVLTTPKHDIPAKLFSAVNYTALFNLLDFGAGVVNVTKVNESDEQKLQDNYPTTDSWYRTAKEACKDSIGYPVNVQVAAPPYREEIVLRLLRDIEIAVTGK
uniref:fatty acid amide hydrolase n=1 Tax=Haemonchus contortus TaxID=6289 RepID=A0A7I4YI29_HAECO|nr:Amidase domain containing protein [Haemonchus contortus]